jgi:hypothetical protein
VAVIVGGIAEMYMQVGLLVGLIGRGDVLTCARCLLLLRHLLPVVLYLTHLSHTPCLNTPYTYVVLSTHPQHKRKERIMLLNRKGFVKIAVEQGLDGGIIPVYHLGNTQVRGAGHTFFLFVYSPGHRALGVLRCAGFAGAGCRRYRIQFLTRGRGEVGGQSGRRAPACDDADGK